MPTLQPWTILSTKIAYTDEPHIKVTADTVRLPDGRQVQNYYQINSRPSCAVVASDEEGRLIMLRQYKHGAKKVCLTFPGGRLEEDETIAQAAIRELREETGYEAKIWRCLGEYPIHANQHVGIVAIFRAFGASQNAKPNPGDLEEMEIVRLSDHEVRSALYSGELALLGDVAAYSLAALID
ncbi:MAG: NUDIX hydrolase [Chloroflexota bacterium]